MNQRSLVPAILFLLIFLIQNSFAQEICSNNIDDDGDGLVDCFDNECSDSISCNDFFYGVDLPECMETPNVQFNFNLVEQWQSARNVETRTTPIIGDIDGDGYPEVIASHNSPNSVYIFDGRDGSLKATINAETDTYCHGVGIADVDRDGFGEVYLVDANGILRAYDANGAVLVGFVPTQISRAIGGAQAQYKFSPHPAFADFNQDGIPEIYIGNQVFDAINGGVIAEAADVLLDAKGAMWNGNGQHRFPVAYDVLPDAYCADCAGLELICGHTVYSVNVATNSLTVASTLSIGVNDGPTAIADWNGDDQMDVIFATGCCGTGGKIVIWDPRTGNPITTDPLGNIFTMPHQTDALGTSVSGLPSIGDFDGDNQLEMAFVRGTNELVVLDNDMTELWTIPVNDGSGITTCSSFDFEGDGRVEVVYRDERSIFVIDGTTGAIRAQSQCGSATRVELPVIADVDADGEAEIVCNCADSDVGTTGTVRAFESDVNDWMPTRTMWNQVNYVPVFVNDDLTIPPTIQNKATVIKQDVYLAQSNFISDDGTIIHQAIPDLVISVDSVYLNDCADVNADVAVTICNDDFRAHTLDFDLSYYNGDPTVGGTLIGTDRLTAADVTLSSTSCMNYTFTVPTGDYDLHVYVNDDGSDPLNAPAIMMEECDSSNNLGIGRVESCVVCDKPTNLAVQPQPSELCIGEDETFTVSFNGSPTFDYYISWYDTSGALIKGPLTDGTADAELFDLLNAQLVHDGNWTVRIEDGDNDDAACYEELEFSVEVNEAPNLVLPSGPLTICSGDSVSLDASVPNANYLWNTGSTDSVISVRSSGSYDVRITSDLGCQSFDTIEVTVRPAPAVRLMNDTTLCAGDSILLNAGNPGQTFVWNTGATTQTIWVSTSGTYDVLVGSSCTDADTINISTVALTIPAVSSQSDTLCDADSYPTLFGNALNAGESGNWSSTQTVVPNGLTDAIISAGSLTGGQTYSFIYSISNGICPDNADSMTLLIHESPATPILVTPSPFETCQNMVDVAVNAPNPSTSIGTWSVIAPAAGAASFDPLEVNDTLATLSGLTVGRTTVRYAVINGSCPAVFVDLDIDKQAELTTPLLFLDGGVFNNTHVTDSTVHLCSNTAYSVTGNSPNLAVGESAIWSIVSGTDVGLTPGGSIPIQNLDLLTASASILSPTRLEWKITSGIPSCGTDSGYVDVVVFDPPTGEYTISDDTLCDGESLTLNSSVPFPSGSFELDLKDTLNPDFQSIATGDTYYYSNMTIDDFGNSFLLTYTDSNQGCGSILRDTMIYINPWENPQISLTTVSPICEGDSIVVDASIGPWEDSTHAQSSSGWSYNNSSGTNLNPTSETAHQATILAAMSGITTVFFQVNYTYECMSVTQDDEQIAIDVTENPSPQIHPGDTMVCESQLPLNYAVQNTQVGSQVTWYWNGTATDTNNAISIIDHLQEGAYFVIEDNGVCPPDTSNEVHVAINQDPDVQIGIGSSHDVNSSATIYLDDLLTLYGNGSTYGIWEVVQDPAGINSGVSPGTGLITTFNPNGIDGAYVIRFTGYNDTATSCIDTASVNITVLSPVQLPDAFSPNGDGINDAFTILGLNGYRYAVVRIFSRWGNLVYENYNVEELYSTRPWDGRMNNAVLPVGVYYYTIDFGLTVEEANGLDISPISGSVMLLH